MSIIKQDYGSLGNDVQTQMLIAPVLAEMVSDKAYAVGEQFIVNNVLYKITQAVSGANVPLVVGTNCEVSDSITQQINDIKEEYVCGDLFINADTDHSVVANIQATMLELISVIKSKNLKSGIGIARYQGGYYHTYIIRNPLGDIWYIVEYTHLLTEAIIYWQYNPTTLWSKLFSVNKNS